MADSGSASRKRRHECTLENSKTVKAIFKKDDSDDSYSTSDWGLVIEDAPVTRRRGRLCNSKRLKLKMVCEWDQCSKTFSEYNPFISHLKTHIEKDDIAEEEGEGSYFCFWPDCNFISNTFSTLNQHLSYHGYLTKLKSEGTNTEKVQNLPVCNHKPKIVIPIVPNWYLCEWESCFIQFETVVEFFDHMRFHIFHNPKSKKEGIINCCWKGCNKGKFPDQYKLSVHLRMHTKEKVIACPTCSRCFANVTKFCDHRKRQIPINQQSFLCSQCSKFFPSERLLRDHMRLHINHYKCSMCDMTCAKPYILAKHIRYRHLQEKPYKCDQCDFTCVSKYNLDDHLTKHKTEKLFKCEECDFECRSSYGLQRHAHKKHDKEWTTIFECHICQTQFHRGNYLTRHLMKVHDCHWPSGHSRFRYNEDQDGIYRLQTVRYETIDVTEEIMKGSSAQTPALNDDSVKYSVLKRISQDENAVQQFEVVLTEDVQVETANEVFITIDDLDAKGNVLKSETIQAKEILQGEVDV